MLKKHSSESVVRATRPSDTTGDEQAHHATLDNRYSTHEKLAGTNSGQSGFPPGHADGGESAELGAWSAVVTFLLESFALYGASLHPTAAFRVEPFLAQERIARQKGSSRERRERICLLSPSEHPDQRSAEQEHDTNLLPHASIESERAPALDAGRHGRWNCVTSSWHTVLAFWKDRCRERVIKRDIAALVDLDDRTLRDIGIFDRSKIEQVARYGHDY